MIPGVLRDLHVQELLDTGTPSRHQEPSRYRDTLMVPGALRHPHDARDLQDTEIRALARHRDTEHIQNTLTHSGRRELHPTHHQKTLPTSHDNLTTRSHGGSPRTGSDRAAVPGRHTHPESLVPLLDGGLVIARVRLQELEVLLGELLLAAHTTHG